MGYGETVRTVKTNKGACAMHVLNGENYMRSLLIGALLLMPTFALGGQRFTEVVKQNINTVVRVDVVGLKDGQAQASMGSGVLISSKGHFLTCEHVIDGQLFILSVSMRESTTSYKAIVIRRDKARDIALCKIVEAVATPSAKLSTRPVELGEEVVAMGHPYGLGWSVTAGIVSGLNRQGLAINLLQTDAAINPGNSGGPLFNLEGELVGINQSVGVGANSLGFSVSMEEIRKFLSIFEGLGEIK